MTLQINANHFPTPTQEYVAWLDVMGTTSSMPRSMKIAANFMLKLHIAALQAPHANVRLYPIMDGLYASSPSQIDMLAFLGHVFHSVAETFIAETENKFRFLIRGALAHGGVVHGGELPPMLSQALNTDQEYRSRILIGMPMIESFQAEKNAPPFGLFVHDTARNTTANDAPPINNAWWRWGIGEYHTAWCSLRPCMINYYEWCSANSEWLRYPHEKIANHKRLMEQYLI